MYVRYVRMYVMYVCNDVCMCVMNVRFCVYVMLCMHVCMNALLCVYEC